ncbi:MAG: VWA domain-containing protein [Polyangiaceae bacterium]
MPFELARPAWLGLLALLVPLLVLYILKVRRKRLQVGSTWLWQQARRDLMARSPFKKLIFQLPLLLQALALALMALAAARPATRGKAIQGDHVAIIVDTSASMAAVDPKTGRARIELAKDAALSMVDALPPGSDAMILDAGKDARLALPADRDTRRMKSVIAALTAREVEGDLSAAVSLAISRLQQQGGLRRVLVITDGNLAHPAPLSNSIIPIEVIQVGAPMDNAAIVRVDVRAGTDKTLDREQVQAFLMVQNYGTAPRELYVTMRQRNASDVLASRKVVVDAGAKLPVVLTFLPAEGDYGTGLIFDIAPKDALPVDDVAFGRVPAGRKLPIFAAGEGGGVSPFLLRGLVADPDSEVREGSVAELLASPSVPSDALVVIQGACPPNAPGGDLLIVNPPPGDCFGTLVGTSVERPVITSWDHADPRMRFLGFEGVVVGEARLLKPESQHQALLRTDQGVIASDVSTSSRSATLLGFDPLDTTWPRFPSFVVFLRNVVEQARHHRQSGLSGPALAGDPLRVSVPPEVKEVTVQAPEGDPQKLPARDGLAVVPEVQRVGLYELSWTEPKPGTSWVPVNLVSADESDLRREPEDTLGPSVSVTPAQEAVDTRHDQSYLVALVALLFIVFDVWWFTRSPRAERPRHTKRAEVAS